MKMKKLDILDLMSYIMLVIVIVGIIGMVTFNIMRKDNVEYRPKLETQCENLSENELLFFPEYVDSIEIVDNDTQYFANVYYMGKTLYTSVTEAESLIDELDRICFSGEEDTLELEEMYGGITDNSRIMVVDSTTYILELDWVMEKY